MQALCKPRRAVREQPASQTTDAHGVTDRKGLYMWSLPRWLVGAVAITTVFAAVGGASGMREKLEGGGN